MGATSAPKSKGRSRTVHKLIDLLFNLKSKLNFSDQGLRHHNNPDKFAVESSRCVDSHTESKFRLRPDDKLRLPIMIM